MQRRPAPLALLPRVLALAAPASAALAPVTAAERGQVIEGMLRHLQAAYVYPEVAGRMATAVRYGCTGSHV